MASGSRGVSSKFASDTKSQFDEYERTIDTIVPRRDASGAGSDSSFERPASDAAAKESPLRFRDPVLTLDHVFGKQLVHRSQAFVLYNWAHRNTRQRFSDKSAYIRVVGFYPSLEDLRRAVNRIRKVVQDADFVVAEAGKATLLRYDAILEGETPEARAARHLRDGEKAEDIVRENLVRSTRQRHKALLAKHTKATQDSKLLESEMTARQVYDEYVQLLREGKEETVEPPRLSEERMTTLRNALFRASLARSKAATARTEAGGSEKPADIVEADKADADGSAAAKESDG